MIPFIARSRSLAIVMWACIALPATAQLLPPETPVQSPPNGRPPPGARFAPPGGGGLSPGSDPTMLLANSPRVQAELGLSEDQIQRLRQTEHRFRSRHHKIAQAADESSKADMEHRIRTDRGAIDQILTPEQLQRLRQIMLRLEGPCLAIHDRHFAREMRLNREQQQEIASICRQVAMDIRKAIRPPMPGEDACTASLSIRTRIERRQLQGDVRIEGLLSQQQRDKLEQMQGPEIALEPMLPPPCRRGVVAE